ncbi:MAG: propanediol utilization protein, partial [Firmicutes bacterium]|nr:propanediol utilization protein [Bacillota bacterium]
VSIKLEGERGLVFDNVLIRASDRFKAECHLDTDEGNAAGCGPDAVCEIVKVW